MFYKIINNNSEVYNNMADFLLKENMINENNKKRLLEKIPYKWESSWGNSSQQDFIRTITYSGFKFLNADEVDKKVWKMRDDGYWFPNLRTKAGKEMERFLNSVEKTHYNDLLEIVKCNYFLSRFKFPFALQCNDTIILSLDDQLTPLPEEDIIEITYKEFKEIQNEFLKQITFN